mmetsp:Transcript_26860/g.46656  ORF Transcript_26860/g.46656 Transcript_26860/m.46656 type:complete len:162 (-) Transcript_26860:1364-1849(-)
MARHGVGVAIKRFNTSASSEPPPLGFAVTVALQMVPKLLRPGDILRSGDTNLRAWSSGDGSREDSGDRKLGDSPMLWLWHGGDRDLDLDLDPTELPKCSLQSTGGEYAMLRFGSQERGCCGVGMQDSDALVRSETGDLKSTIDPPTLRDGGDNSATFSRAD